ncbi:MAG: hypothetical protein JNL49_06355 [Bacteroidia bacterium]|nr:hypothetical protein [Bacteroidia bacterium]
MRKLTIADLNAIVAPRKGVCLSKEYIDTKVSYKWRCESGHTFDMTITSIRVGAWCPMCRKAIGMAEYVEECRAYAKARGGEFLTKTLKNKKSPGTWKCKNGHEWTVPALDVARKNGWCARCAHDRRKITDPKVAHEFAEKHGGKCLTNTVNGIHSIVTFECKEGHTWQTKLTIKNSKSWCPECSKSKSSAKRTTPYSKIVEIVNACGFELKTPEKDYKTKGQKLLLRCSKGHTWRDTIWSIHTLKRACPKCSNRIISKFHTLSELKKIAASHGGVCLSKKYQPVENMEWKCANNHTFKLRTSRIVKGFWCPWCSGYYKHNIEEMRTIAKERGGKCLSNEWKSALSNLSWRCKEGHRWEALPKSILKGHWCPECSHVKPLSLEDFKAYALKHQGECLNTTYKSHVTPIIFKCKEGHTWRTHRKCINDNVWCRICAESRFTDREIKALFNPGIEDAKILGRAMNGECKSNYFIDLNAPLRWKCNKGHEWKASYNWVRKGTWCPKCHDYKRVESFNAEMLSMIRYHQGKLLSLKITDRVKVACKNGHEFTEYKRNIRYGDWCPKCGLKPAYNYPIALAYANQHGGEILTKYKNGLGGTTTVTWKCNKNHTWSAPLRLTIFTKTWCPECEKSK